MPPVKPLPDLARVSVGPCPEVLESMMVTPYRCWGPSRYGVSHRHKYSHLPPVGSPRAAGLPPISRHGPLIMTIGGPNRVQAKVAGSIRLILMSAASI